MMPLRLSVLVATRGVAMPWTTAQCSALTSFASTPQVELTVKAGPVNDGSFGHNSSVLIMCDHMSTDDCTGPAQHSSREIVRALRCLSAQCEVLVALPCTIATSTNADAQRSLDYG